MAVRTRFFTIGQVGQLTDLPTYTLRFWEKEFKRLSPGKTRTGRRKYSENDIMVIRRIQDLLHKQGYTIKGAREILDGNADSKEIRIETSAGSSDKSEREIYLEIKLRKMKRHIKELLELLAPAK